MRYRIEKPKSPVKKRLGAQSQIVAMPFKDNNRADKIDEINLGGNMSIDIRDIRDDLERIKQVIKIPEEE